MAYVAVTQIKPSIALVAGVAQTLSMAFQNAAGAALDVSGYNSIKLDLLYTVNGQPFQVASTELTTGSTPSFSTPNTSFLFTATQATAAAAGLPPGNYNYVITGKPASGDDPEVLAAGPCALSNAP